MASKKEKPNIIFVTLDACRPDHLGYMGYRRNGESLSPFLDSLAKKGTYFTRAFATGPGSPQSFVAIFTSTYPFDYGGITYLDRPRVFLSEILKRNGYKTMGFHSGAYMSGYFGYDRGWDKFEYLSPFKGGDMMQGIKPGTWQTRIVKKFDALRRFVNKKMPWANWFATLVEKTAFGWRKIWKDLTNYQRPFFTADEMNEEVRKALPKAPEKPLFLWVHYMDIHGPYGLFWQKSRQIAKRIKFHVADFIGYFLGKFYFINKWLLPLYLELYDSCIKYTDEHIKKLFEYLSSIGVLNDESMVAICADHGEEFLERKWVGHSDSVWNVNLNVPLIFYGKKYFNPETVITRPVSLIDFSPTILDLVGLPREKVFKGGNLFDESERPIIGQVPDLDTDLSSKASLGTAVIYGKYKLIHTPNKKMLFSMENDFEEKINLYDKEKEIAARLEKILKPYEFILPDNK